MEVSERDLELVNALQIAPRISWRDAGDVLGEAPNSLADRWNRLRSNGDAWVTAHPPDIASSVTWVDFECTLDKRDAVIQVLSSIPEIVNIDETEHSGIVSTLISTVSASDLRSRVLKMAASIDGVTRYEIASCTRIYVSGDSWRLNSLSKKQQQLLQAFSIPKVITDAPRPTLEMQQLLLENGRASAADIQRIVGGHPSTVRRHLNRLLKSEHLAFRCELAQVHSGRPVTCMWQARVRPDKHVEAARQLVNFRHIRMVASTTGATNFRFLMWLRATSDVQDIEVLIQEKLPFIELIRSSVLPRPVKRMGWTLREDTRVDRAIGFPL